MVILSFVLVIILFISVDYFVQKRQLKTAAARHSALAEVTVDEIPAGLFLQGGHLWQQIERNGNIRLGADMLPITALGDVDKAEVAMVGDKIKKGDPIAVLSYKGKDMVLRSHTDGVVSAVNLAAIDDPAGIPEDPYGEGWLIEMKPVDVSAAFEMGHVGTSAKEWIRAEFARFRDMLAGLANDGLAPATLQDGGMPTPGLSQHLNEESWKQVSEWITDADRS